MAEAVPLDAVATASAPTWEKVEQLALTCPQVRWAIRMGELAGWDRERVLVAAVLALEATKRHAQQALTDRLRHELPPLTDAQIDAVLAPLAGAFRDRVEVILRRAGAGRV